MNIPLSTAKLGDNVLGSVSLSVCLSVRQSTAKSTESHYQSEVFVCVSVISSAGTSPTFWTRGLAAFGLAGTRGLASPI